MREDAWMAKSRLCWLDYETTGVDLADPKVVPIELGYVITDIDLHPIDEDNLLINWGFDGIGQWSDYSDSAEYAYSVHKIGLEELCIHGTTPEDAAYCLHHASAYNKPEDGRMILISDNIQFEWNLTKQLMAKFWPVDSPMSPPWPFHYCGWDTSVLQLVKEIEFNDPPNPPHRALPDVKLLLDTVRKALGG